MAAKSRATSPIAANRAAPVISSGPDAATIVAAKMVARRQPQQPVR